jgi:hypothetical protein
MTSFGTTSLISAPCTALVTTIDTSNAIQNSAMKPSTKTFAPVAGAPSRACTQCPSAGDSAMPMNDKNAGGVAASRNGMRRPQRLRNRSLRKLTTGDRTTDSAAGVVPIIRPTKESVAPNWRSRSCIAGRIARSRSCQKKSPPSSHPNSRTSATRV